MQQYELLTCAVDIGRAMLESGADIHRVEESIGRILSAYDAKEPEIFATPESIIVTVTENNGRPLTKSERIYSRETNLGRVDMLNSLSRKICATKPSKRQVYIELEKILAAKRYHGALITLAYAAIGCSYALFFGGSLTDAAVGAFAALVIRFIEILIHKHHINAFFSCILCSVSAAAISVACGHYGINSNVEAAMLGALMTLVPGIIITNCMRDLIAADYMSGLHGFIEALLTATGIAVGVALALAISGGGVI